MFKSYYLLLPLSGLLLLPCCYPGNSPANVNNLMCENLQNPVGIGTIVPRLSWNLSSTQKGTSQEAYQILAATRTDLLDENSADLWNTGKVASSDCVLVPWQGKMLASMSFCSWKVRVWDEAGKVSEWSEPAVFTTGLLKKDDWKGGYIGLPGDTENCESPQLRKTFTLNGKTDRFILHVNSLGYHEIWINGQKAGDHVLVPAVSQFDKRSLSVSYDISPMVKEGRNDLIIWTGQGWYSKGLPGVAGDGPLVRAQLESNDGLGSETILCTDSTWTGRKSGYSTIGTWRPGKFGGEMVDASLILADLSPESIDKADWIPVKTFIVPDHEITPQMAEKNTLAAIVNPDTIYSLGNYSWLIDMGTTLTGWFEIDFAGLRMGQEVVLEYSDHFGDNGMIADQGQIDRYFASGNEAEHFINKFNYHGYRYVKISNLEKEPVRSGIKGYLIHTGYSTASSFECSDDELNTIHDMISYTVKCLSLGGYLVDCPQIERLGYGGDGNASTQTAQTMYDLGPLYGNWMQAWSDCIRDDGGMPHTAPNPYPAGGGPYWCGFIITASWRTYINYGDIRFLEEYYPVMQKWLGYADKYSSENLLRQWPDTEYRGWYLGDWATPEGVDQTDESSVDLVNNCFMTVCYETMSKIAGVLGKSEDEDKYGRLKESVIESINKEFLDLRNSSYASGSQIDLTYPLLAGVVPDTLKDKVTANLLNLIKIVKKGHIACGLVGIPVFTEWSVNNNQADLFYSILKKKDYPGYLYMIENGATTTWEHWNGARSRIHNCYNGIGSWFYQALGGIRTDENFPGYRHVIIDPQVPDGVSWANVTKDTPYGSLAVNWKKDEGTFRIELKIPVGCTASVRIPDEIEIYKLDGKEFDRLTAFADLKSGNYIIEY